VFLRGSYASPSSIEAELCNIVSSDKSEQLSLLESLVNVNSGTSNLDGIHQVGEMLRNQLNSMGFTTHWVNMPVDMQRAGTLISEHQGSKGKRLLLIAHLDTVFAKNSPFQQFKLKDNRATGPGVIDDKGGIVVILYALKALQALHALDGTSITIAFVGDEESSGKPTSISKKPLIDAAQHSDIALEFEPSFSLNTAVTSYAGMSGWTVETHGTSAHSSDIFTPAVGDGAIFELARILNAMRVELADSRYLSFNPGIILGGTTIHFDKNISQGDAFGKMNVVAQAASATGDLRYFTTAQKESAQETIMAIVTQHLLGTTATVEFSTGKPPMIATTGNMELLKKYSNVSIDLGFGEVKKVEQRLSGAGDLSYAASLTPANLSGLGAVGIGLHSTDETLDINSLQVATQRAAILIYRLTH